MPVDPEDLGAPRLPPTTPRPGPARAGAGRPGRPRPRYWLRRLVALLVLLVVMGGAATGVGYGYLRYRYAQIRSLSIPVLTAGGGDRPFNVLLVGSDSRASLGGPGASQAFGSASQVAGQRSDVTAVLHVDPGAHRAALLSIPRDLFVPIAGTGRTNRINTAFDSGAGQLIETIQTDLGIPIQHYVAVNFDGFQNAVDALDGVDLDFPYPARDAWSGLRITTAGCQHLDGTQALAVARSRHYQYYADGRWHDDPTGDLGRIRRQHVFLRAVVKAALSKGVTNPFTANAFIGAVVHDFTIDDGLSLTRLAGLARSFRSFDPAQMASYTLPAEPVTNYRGYGDVLLPEPDQDQQVIARFLHPDTTPGGSAPTSAAPAPSQVTVRVLNGVGINGLAHRAAAALAGAGFTVAATGNAATTGRTGSEIDYGPAGQPAAAALAARLAGGATLQPDPSITDATVTLVLGSGWEGLSSPGGGTAGATSGQAPPTTTAAAPTPDTTPAYDPHGC